MEGLSGEYAVGVYRLKTGENYGFNQRVEMPAASIMKVPILAAVFRKLEIGDLKLEDTYALKDADKQSGSGPIEFMNAGAKLTVKQLVTYMAKNSDNTAAYVLANMVGRREMEIEIERLGMKNTDFGENTTTAEDVAAMWQKIYEEKNQQTLDLLQGSIYEERIPAGVPDGTRVIHKVGTDLDIWSDAGIVMAEKPFILVIMNEGVDIDRAKKLVPELTKLIWDFEAERNAKPQ
ncbi:MAG: Beta-lactamase [Candidatus Moranbacteria bacterium GW2011_GWF2_44_10]|nr:MAG: Beta-lactamase [Candidatus Moranbacteria bacterium GW2011_GWF2_44_10]